MIAPSGSRSQAGHQQDPPPDQGCQRIHVPISQQVGRFHRRERQRKQRLHSSGGSLTCQLACPLFFSFLFLPERLIRKDSICFVQRGKSVTRSATREFSSFIGGISLFAHLACTLTTRTLQGSAVKMPRLCFISASEVRSRKKPWAQCLIFCKLNNSITLGNMHFSVSMTSRISTTKNIPLKK